MLRYLFWACRIPELSRIVLSQQYLRRFRVCVTEEGKLPTETARRPKHGDVLHAGFASAEHSSLEEGRGRLMGRN